MIQPVDSPFTNPSMVVSSITMYSVRPSAAAEGRRDRPAAIDRDTVSHGAALDDTQKLTGVEAADPDPALDVDAQAVGVPFGTEVGEIGWCTEAAVGFDRERENPRSARIADDEGRSVG